ncbi:SDR family oxidoreductase [Thermoproteota archaeon]
MAKKVILFGHTGKMGIALNEIFKIDYEVIGKNTKDFDAADFTEVRNIIEEEKPDIVINTVAFMNADLCEKDPDRAFRLNTLFPKLLAELSNKFNFSLAHFSSAAVFNNEKKEPYVESDTPKPINVYGMTKYGGDCMVEAIAGRYYIFRLPILFGRSKKNQFVEKMLHKIKMGETVLRIADDITDSPSYSKDIAEEVKRILEDSLPFGLYHIANKGSATLFDLISEIVMNLELEIKVEKASHMDFPSISIKNTHAAITSERIRPLRPWQEAVRDYILHLKSEQGS